MWSLKFNQLYRFRLTRFALQKPWSLLSWTSGILAAWIVGFYSVQLPFSKQVGVQLVQTEWPNPAISPGFYAKPISWFCYLAFMFWMFSLESHKPWVKKRSYFMRRVFFMFSALVAFISFYEVFWNFSYWSAAIASVGGNPDFLTGPIRDTTSTTWTGYPINLDFVSKVVTLVFALGIYSTWFFSRLQDKE